MNRERFLTRMTTAFLIGCVAAATFGVGATAAPQSGRPKAKSAGKPTVTAPEPAEPAQPEPEPPVLPGTGKLDWTTDYGAALQQAKAENKLVFINFTGSDWCPYCFSLRDEVFVTQDFERYAKRNLVLLEIDFPRRKELPKEQKARNKELASMYRVRGFPTIVVLSPEGKQVGALGYQPGGPRPFLAELNRMREVALRDPNAPPAAPEEPSGRPRLRRSASAPTETPSAADPNQPVSAAAPTAAEPEADAPPAAPEPAAAPAEKPATEAPARPVMRRRKN